jgi:hypothetical protein
VIREHLPYAIVHYPASGGLLFGFARDESSRPMLCACAQAAVEHAVLLAGGENEQVILDGLALPVAVTDQLGTGLGPAASLSYGPKLCHRCNMAAPVLRYCHEVEGGRFIQHYGWYVGQAYLRFGIAPLSFAYLSDVCPDRILPYVQAVEAASRALGDDPDLALAPQVRPDGAPGADVLALAERRYLARAYRRACRSLDKWIENTVRREFGFEPVGEGWISEAMLYQIICRIYPGQEVLRREHPGFLEGLELDIYVPALKLAIEYQGQQHFHPIRAWGGKAALQAVQDRDARKAALCVEHGVRLVTVDYTEPLSEGYIRARLVEHSG